MTNPDNPTSRALRCIETLDVAFPGYTIQQAVTELFRDLMCLESEKPERLHLIGAMEDARNIFEEIERVDLAREISNQTGVDQNELDDAIASGKVVDFVGRSFAAGHMVKETEHETPVA